VLSQHRYSRGHPLETRSRQRYVRISYGPGQTIGHDCM